MTSPVRRPRIHAPKCVQAEIIHKAICPCTLMPSGAAGLITIDSKAYGFCYLAERDKQVGTITIHGYRLLTGEGKVYDIPESVDECCCPDSTFRQRLGG